MSRFFAAHSDSESSSSSSESEDEQPKFAPTAAAFAFSDDEEDTKRVVRSAKEKRYESLHTTIKAIRNSKKINDFNKMESSFVDLCKAYEKAKPVIIKEEPNGETPRFYLKILVEMEDMINKTWEDKDLRKNMNKNNSKSLGTLRQKLRKYIRTDFEDAVAKFRENPDEGEEEEPVEKEAESAEESEAEEEAAAAPKAKVDASKFKKTAAAKDDDDESDDSYWSDSDDSSSSSDLDPSQTLIEKFLKKKGPPGTKTKDEDDKKKKATRMKKARDRKLLEEEDEDEDDDDWIKVDHGAADKPKMFDKDAEINHPLVVKKLIEIMAARGKKRTNRKEQIELLTELFRISEEHQLGPAISIKIQFAICAAIFDYNPKISAAMKPEYWEKCMPAVEFLLKLINDNEDMTIGDHISDEQEVLEEKPYKVRGCYLSVVERLDEEFMKVLKSCDAHSHEYVDRLKDEPRVVQILNEAQRLVERSGHSRDLCRVYLKRIEHVYFKFDPNVMKQKNGEIPAKEETSVQLMDKFCKYIYAHDSTDRLRTQAILCHIYHHAIHDQWFEARDLMLMSHLQDAISHADPITQILYNRTMVQLGLCGFRHAEIREAHNALLDIQLQGRSKELIAQGLLPQRHHERSTEQEKIEKQRQVPFHMHINLEMLECVYLVSAMLMEIPYMAAHEFDARRRMISKSYYQQLRSSERQALVGPAESMREHVVAASKAMRNGDWKKCKELIINDKMNAKVWDLFNEADKVRAMLTKKIQEETLRTYLFTFSKVYDSISVPSLAELFEMKKETVHAIVSKMIINEELMASLDEPSECMVMHRTEPTRLQSLSLQLSDKIAQLVENNERLLELRPGGWQGQWRGKDDRGGGGNREGGVFGGSGRGGSHFGSSNRGNFGGGKNVKFGGDRKYQDKKNYGEKRNYGENRNNYGEHRNNYGEHRNNYGENRNNYHDNRNKDGGGKHRGDRDHRDRE